MNFKKNKSLFVRLSKRILERDAKHLVKSGKMPTLDELCAAVLEVRVKYANQIRRARREAREVVISTKSN